VSACGTLPAVDRADLVTGRAQPGDREPADAPLRHVQDLVNTVDRENVVELLDAPQGLADWLAHRHLPGAGDVTARDLRRALELREALRAVLLANNGGADDPAARAVLEAVGRRAGLRAVFDPGGHARLRPSAGGVDGALGTVVAVAFSAMADGSWARLKACPREVCHWAFYDRSPANRATWCSMQVCGNRVKAGTYYRRRRSAA
jgi:predicted RNA-binding Zn ribbon-like protein